MKIDGLRGNCTLVATRELTGLPDETITERFLKDGWKPGTGWYTGSVVAYLREWGFQVEHVDLTSESGAAPYTRRVHRRWYGEVTVYVQNGLTLKQFGKKYPTGAYLVTINRHALVVRDGRIVDPNFSKERTRARVKSAYRVVNAAESLYFKQKPHKARKDRLRRNGDPLVGFVGYSIRRANTEGRNRETTAVRYLNLNGWNRGAHPGFPLLPMVRLSELVSKTEYTRADAAHDIRHGRLVVAPGK
jgi:hypothetical protein